MTAADGSTVAPADVLGAARRGRTLVFSGDTRPCAAVRRAALGADLLVHEASFASEDRARAKETRHSTAAEAAELAVASEVKLLALTHLGARATPRQIKDEARAVFANTVVPRDFDTIELPLPERGGPELRRGGAHPDEGRSP